MTQGRNEVKWRPGQEASLTPPYSNLRSFGNKCTVLTKVLVALLGLFGHPAMIRRPGNCAPLVTPLLLHAGELKWKPCLVGQSFPDRDTGVGHLFNRPHAEQTLTKQALVRSLSCCACWNPCICTWQETEHSEVDNTYKINAWFPLTIGYLFARWPFPLFLFRSWVIWNNKINQVPCIRPHSREIVYVHKKEGSANANFRKHQPNFSQKV